MCKAKKILVIGDVVDVRIGDRGIKKCEIVYMKAMGIGAREIGKGKRTHNVPQSAVVISS